MPSVEELSAQLAQAKAENIQLSNDKAALKQIAKEQLDLLKEVGERIRSVNEMLQ